MAPGTMSAAMPIGANASGSSDISANSNAPSNAASHSAWRNSGAISPRRPAPSSCDTDGGNAISTPIGAIIGSQNSAAPTATEASVWVPWWPATTVSTKPTNPCDRCPAASGAARRAVRSTSSRKRGEACGDADMLACSLAVIPANAGIQLLATYSESWIPAFAG